MYVQRKQFLLLALEIVTDIIFSQTQDTVSLGLDNIIILLLLTLFALDHFQIPSHMAVITGLFYLKATKVSGVKVITVKKELTTLRIRLPSNQSFTKESLIVLLGKELFKKGKVKRKNSEKIISKDNLVLID